MCSKTKHEAFFSPILTSKRLVVEIQEIKTSAIFGFCIITLHVYREILKKIVTKRFFEN